MVLQIWMAEITERLGCFYDFPAHDYTQEKSTYLPSFDNSNDRLCQERLLRPRHVATMVTWRHMHLVAQWRNVGWIDCCFKRYLSQYAFIIMTFVNPDERKVCGWRFRFPLFKLYHDIFVVQILSIQLVCWTNNFLESFLRYFGLWIFVINMDVILLNKRLWLHHR